VKISRIKNSLISQDGQWPCRSGTQARRASEGPDRTPTLHASEGAGGLDGQGGHGHLAVAILTGIRARSASEGAGGQDGQDGHGHLALAILAGTRARSASEGAGGQDGQDGHGHLALAILKRIGDSYLPRGCEARRPRWPRWPRVQGRVKVANGHLAICPKMQHTSPESERETTTPDSHRVRFA
jgi:hypothetical protein